MQIGASGLGLREALQTTAILLSYAAILFGAAGRADWAAAWTFLAVYSAFVVLAFLLLDPELIRERTHFQPNAERWDILLASFAFVWLFPLTLLVAALDAGRFEWSPTLPLALQLIGLVFFIAGNSFAFWAMRVNVFFSAFVRIQEERGHRVVSGGPYAYVRHPGYAGAIVAAIALPLLLGSLCALLPAFIGSSLFVLRTWREDETLQKELKGYAEYCRRVRSRLLPGVW